tara:strand:- start:13224 stop:13901 length:678 start_codon:yes stop_codon:yes gene_type:complete
MKRHDIINSLISKYNLRNYLEIGVFIPEHNFNKIIAENKEGVEPGIEVDVRNNYMDGVNPPTAKMNFVTSDDFFKSIEKSWWNEDTKKYDIIFIDGLHLEEQVDKDIENCLKHLNDGGFIVLHDCNPENEFRVRPMEEFYKDGKPWNGTVYKSIVKLRCSRDDLDIKVVDTDEGCGIIQVKNSKLYEHREKVDINNIKYDLLENDRKNLLNLISPKEFKKIYLGD